MKTLGIADRKDNNCLEMGNTFGEPYSCTRLLPGENFQAMVHGGEIQAQPRGQTPRVKETELCPKGTKADRVCRAAEIKFWRSADGKTWETNTD